MKKYLHILLLAFLTVSVYGKDGEGGAAASPPAFNGPMLIHVPTTEAIGKSILDFRFNHRFGDARRTSYDFFGLDQGANTLMSLDYGITDKWSAGVARITALKTYEVRSKYSIISQSNSFPVSISIFGAIGQETQKQFYSMGPFIRVPSNTTPIPALNSKVEQDINRYELSPLNRTSYMASIAIARRFNDYFSLQLTPMFVHRNFVKYQMENDRVGLDVGGRIKLYKGFYLIFETILTPKRDYIGDNYNTVDKNKWGEHNELSPVDINNSYPINQPANLFYVYMHNVAFDKKVPHYYVPASLGISYETGGHIFQIFATNTRALASTQLLRGADYDYFNKDWTIGFNINRYYSFAEESKPEEF